MTRSSGGSAKKRKLSIAAVVGYGVETCEDMLVCSSGDTVRGWAGNWQCEEIR
jgi:hypothetical protein